MIPLIGGAIGSIIAGIGGWLAGTSFGVAGFGTAVTGSIVFGPISAIIGGLSGALLALLML